MANERIPDETRDKLAAMAQEGARDDQIALSLNIHPSTVRRIRLSLGIKRGVKADRVVVAPEQIEELRTVSDRAMERKYGIDHKSWALVRKKNGIAQYRRPTTGPLAKPKAPKPASKPKPRQRHIVTIANPREVNLASEAADFLRRDRWMVVNRAKVYADSGWNVGRMRLTTEELIHMAQRKGFKPEPWMGR